jgi:small subunit ribosomal protein S7
VKDHPVSEIPKGPNQEQLPHVSEEAAAMGEVTGEAPPDIEEHGTPVQEVRGKERPRLQCS